MFTYAVLKERAECPFPPKPFRLPPLATYRSGHGRLAKAVRQEPIVGLFNRGISVAWHRVAGGPEDKAGSPGNGAATV